MTGDSTARVTAVRQVLDGYAARYPRRRMTAQIVLRLPPEILTWLREAAAANDVTVSEFARAMLISAALVYGDEGVQR